MRSGVSHDFSALRTLTVIQSRLREEHALQEVLYKTLLAGGPTALPPRSVSHVQTKHLRCTADKQLCSINVRREDASVEPLNACRIHGHAYVNKVAGNLHITVGK